MTADNITATARDDGPCADISPSPSAHTMRLIRHIATGDESRFIASNETKRAKGGRPRKHDSAADRQAAYRARNSGIVTWRLGDVAGKIAEIASSVDLPANELAHQMLKFALSNRDWRQNPMFGRPLPNALAKAARKTES